MTRNCLLILWTGSLVLLLFALGNPPVQRTQEARVLETARESLGSGFHGWMIPHLNGDIRLRKPPLAYWLSASAYLIGGVSPFVGRLPMALIGWLTVGLVYLFAKRIALPIAGVLSASVLLGSFLFFKNSRQAETDILITLFNSVAVYAMWLGMDRLRSESHYSKWSGWFLLSGAMIGLSIIGKGPPAAFPIVFLLGCAAVERRIEYLICWFKSGAPLVALLIGAPWWLYVSSLPHFREIFTGELANAFEGRDHFQPFWAYGPMLLKASVPWCGFGIAALIASIQSSRRSIVDRRMLLWAGSVLIPLCFVGNKQDHYVLPLMPPLAIITGVWIWRASSDIGRNWRTVLKVIFFVTLGLMSITPIAVPLVGLHTRGEHHVAADWIAAATLFIGVATCWWSVKRFDLQRAVTTFAIVVAVSISPLFSLWAPSLRQESPKTIANRIRSAAGESRTQYVFYGSNFSLPLVFEMRQVIAQAPNAESLDKRRNELKSNEQLIVLAQTKSESSPPPLPSGFWMVDEITNDDQKYEVYRSTRATSEPASVPTSAPATSDSK